MTIDRIDSTKNYEPSNCQWLLWLDNVRKHALRITAWGETKRSYEWLEDERCKADTTKRIRSWIGPEEAISTPVNYRLRQNHSEDSQMNPPKQEDQRPDPQ